MTDNAEADKLPKNTKETVAISENEPIRRSARKANPKPKQPTTTDTTCREKPSQTSPVRKGKTKGHSKVPEPTLVVEGIRHSVKVAKSRSKSNGKTDTTTEASGKAPSTKVADPEKPSPQPKTSRGTNGTALLAQAAMQTSSQTLPGAPLTLPLVTPPTLPQKDPPPPPPPPAPASPPSPGKRRGIPHTYTDYSNEPVSPSFVRKKTGGVTKPFPEKLHEMLSLEKDSQDIVGWLPHGRAFIVRKPHQFTDSIMGKYFRQTKLTSFQRQLNLCEYCVDVCHDSYLDTTSVRIHHSPLNSPLLDGFRRITQGPDAGAYYHELFLQNKPQLCMRMQRQKVKGTGHKLPADAETEPNFYAYPFVTGATPPPEMESPGMQGLRGAANLLQGISAGLPPAALLSRPAQGSLTYSTSASASTNPQHWQYASAVARHSSLVGQEKKLHTNDDSPEESNGKNKESPKDQSHGDNATGFKP